MATSIGKPCNHIPFELFCRVCEDICNAKNEKKILLLEKFISKCRGSTEKSDIIKSVSHLVLNKLFYAIYIINIFRKILSTRFYVC